MTFTEKRHQVLLVVLLTFVLPVFGQNELPLSNPNSLDHSLLNNFILEEVNKVRKKARTSFLENSELLSRAAQNHASYCLKKEKLTHFQKRHPLKSPKNRVDHFNGQFEIVGENIQQTNLRLKNSPKDRRNPRLDTYEKLAKELVLNWKNSPPHYANLIEDNFMYTYTEVKFDEEGNVYACQLFGGNIFNNKYKNEAPELSYKSENLKKCKSCTDKDYRLSITISEKGEIIAYAEHKKGFEMFLKNPFTAGIAADIVVKSQYPDCAPPSFNNRLNIRGIGLEPIYKKDFKKKGRWQRKYPYISLGFVPDYIDEPFEVNLTVINKKRPCMTIIYNQIPAGFSVDLPLDINADTASRFVQETKRVERSAQMFFDKSSINPKHNLPIQFLDSFKYWAPYIKTMTIQGFASIEGTEVQNKKLYTERANKLRARFMSLGMDSTKCVIGAQENFEDFYADIKGTQFESLGELNKAQIRDSIKGEMLDDSLESILQNHRYAKIDFVSERKYIRKLDADTVLKSIQNYINNSKESSAEKAFNILYNFYVHDEIELDALLKIKFKSTEMPGIQLQIAYLKFYAATDTLNNIYEKYWSNEAITLEKSVNYLLTVNEKDKSLLTAQAIIDFYRNAAIYGGEEKMQAYFLKFRDSLKRVDSKVTARALFNIAAAHDFSIPIHERADFELWGNLVYDQSRKAKLSIDELFELSSYYLYINENDKAYDLVRRKIDETEDLNDLIYFIKLIYYMDIDISQNKMMKYFALTQDKAGDEFCTFFNSPKLNFQILDEAIIRQFYCDHCSNYQP